MQQLIKKKKKIWQEIRKPLWDYDATGFPLFSNVFKRTVDGTLRTRITTSMIYERINSDFNSRHVTQMKTKWSKFSPSKDHFTWLQNTYFTSSCIHILKHWYLYRKYKSWGGTSPEDFHALNLFSTQLRFAFRLTAADCSFDSFTQLSKLIKPSSISQWTLSSTWNTYSTTLAYMSIL